MSEPLLQVDDLQVAIGPADIVRGVSFAVAPGETLGIVGESGSGKTMTVLAATGLLDAPGRRISGSSLLRTTSGEAVQLTGASPRTLRRVHGGQIGFVFQDPSTSLNPMLTIGRQIEESLEAHRGLTRRAARSKATELLDAVGIPQPEQRVDSYPHQLSGGQRQRAMIAIALACDPGLLIADEPTTALDVTTQAQIIDLVRELQSARGTAVVWISHDLGVIGQVADDVLVMATGSVVEHRPITEVYYHPQHDYTRQLLAARPRLGKTAGPPPADPDADVLLEVRNLDVRFPVATPSGRSMVHAVNDVSFEIRRGTTTALVGESGSGKSTIANVLTGLLPPRAGTAELGTLDLLHARRADRRRIAMVFQDPFASLDPRRSVADALTEPLRTHGLGGDSAASREERAIELLEQVGLPAEFRLRYPHELSGGQRQRVSIARALALEPEIIILDEATASLDVSVQATVLDLLAELQKSKGLTYLFIAHDLAIVQQMSHNVLVLRDGVVVEAADAETLFADPIHDYTKMLLAAIPPDAPRAAPGGFSEDPATDR
ncbi:MAG TPA: ABC transporter ATP-binding protein [Propionicimonas sp.]|nr:ABC transporter ATP-binding protein [Propionicimonas sp.]